ncbi:MAG TPA: M23 family metallopeptidase [Bauldia sp.]|nr:M23 family metallopeptidase [Bauldia sp.]
MRGRTGRNYFGLRGDVVDLGTEPPLVVGGEDEEAPVRRGVSVRWLCGTILTGLASTFLMGGALMAALNNPNQLAARPDALQSASADPAAGVAFGRKGDRMRPTEEAVSSRQILQVSTVTKQGERDFIKLRPFARVVATLSSPSPENADRIPEYDALRIFADTSAPEPPADSAATANAAGDDQFYGAEVDGEVSVKISDFPAGPIEKDPRIVMAAEDVEAIVRASATFGGSETDMAALSFIDPGGSGDEFAGEEDPFSAMGVKIIPENVSNVAKSEGATPGMEDGGERFIDIAKGQSFRELLAENEITEADIDAIIAALSDLVDLNAIHVGQKVRVAYATDLTADGSVIPLRVSIYDEGAHQATVARTDDNSFVRADEPTLAANALADASEEVESYSGTMPRLYDAVYETALKQEVPEPLIEQLVRIFAYDVDFQARISPGDTLEVFHSLPDEDPDASEPEVLFAALTLNGITKRFYRFRTPDDGVVDYYDDEGKSAKKFLMRKPMTTGVLRSGFGMRRHPILKYTRMHTGVDFAAPRGTPILAAGNGVVEKAGRDSGYGNVVVISHTNGYATVYAHQQGFAKGLTVGSRVRQGQVIGYVGSTGLSTGPHLHFEIRVNDKPVDPLRIRLPRGRVLENEMLASFERERERIDSLLGNDEEPPTKVAAADDSE